MRLGLQAATFLFCSFLLALSACGKKGPPSIPEEGFSLTVKGLKAEWDREGVVLTGEIISTSGKTPHLENIAGCRVYHALYPLRSPPCEGCPLDFTGTREISDDVIENSRIFHITLPIRKTKGHHFFQVRLLSRAGTSGPMSDKVKLIVR